MSLSFQRKLVCLMVALSLCAAYFYLAGGLAPAEGNNSTNVHVFTATSKYAYHLDKLNPAFRPRIAGLWLSGRLIDLFVKDRSVTLEKIQVAFGIYNAGWLFLLFLAVILLSQDSLFTIFGCFAGLIYNFTPKANFYCYPWDMPAIVFFTLSILFWYNRRYPLMLAAIFVGFLFKETVAVTALLFFFTDLPRRRKLQFFLGACLLTLLLKMTITLLIEGHVSIVTQQWRSADPSLSLVQRYAVLANTVELFSPSWNHFIFVNGGTFIIALCLPWRTKADLGVKVLLVAFFCGMIWAGNLQEFRVMGEVLPISVMALRRYWCEEASDQERI